MDPALMTRIFRVCALLGIGAVCCALAMAVAYEPYEPDANDGPPTRVVAVLGPDGRDSGDTLIERGDAVE
jgi:hypothetical protein